MGAALRARDRVDLVDDDVLDATQDVAGLAGEQEVERLRRRDEDVRRPAGEVPAILGGRVAGPAGDRDVRRRLTESGGGQADAGQRRPEVPLDVVGQRFERRDVQDADRAGLLPRLRRTWRRREAVEGPEEGGEGLAAAGRGVDERVLASRDRCPALRLGLRRRLERRLEPGPDGRAERSERVGYGSRNYHGRRV